MKSLSLTFIYSFPVLIISHDKHLMASLIFARLEVDIKGDTTQNADEGLQPGHLTLIDSMKTLNPWFSSVEGNPIPQVVNEDE